MWHFLFSLFFISSVSASGLVVTGDDCVLETPIVPLTGQDCSIVSCMNPVCLPDEVSYTPTGSCCPSCKKDCSTTICQPIGIVSCPSGERIASPPEVCCDACKPICDVPSTTPTPMPEPTCVDPDCSVTVCGDPPICNSLEVLETPTVECCPRCITNCQLVLCALPDCIPGEIPVTLPGECCPVCKTDCNLVDCPPASTLGPGEILYAEPGECCQTCRPLCTAPTTPEPTTPSTNITTTISSGCHDVEEHLAPDCSAVSCLNPEPCPSPQVVVTPPGECCPICKMDCRLVRCAMPTCSHGEQPITPVDRCCPICKPCIAPWTTEPNDSTSEQIAGHHKFLLFTAMVAFYTVNGV